MPAKQLVIARAFTDRGFPHPVMDLDDGRRVATSMRLCWIDAGAILFTDWENMTEFLEPGTAFSRDPILVALVRQFAAYEMGMTPDPGVRPFDFEIPTLEQAIEFNRTAPKLTTDLEPTAEEWDARLIAHRRP